ncbi:MAG: peptidoglycan-associated lipoprotein Pal [Burkholderiaceae bacterium]|nr:peptidoglycan-associated lipoprotein Pal [Burkholderiaceae bacterium]
MRINNAITLSAIAAGALLLAACKTEEPKPVQQAAQPPVTQPRAADTRTVTPQTAEVDPLDNPKGALADRSVYFDFDSYVVKSDYNQLVTNHGKYLDSHHARKIQIQGNTDERGTAEYNLALGQKRAEAVRKGLAAMGVSDAQMEATSFGKTKPKAEGHDEAAWSQNRRADIVYAGK